MKLNTKNLKVKAFSGITTKLEAQLSKFIKKNQDIEIVYLAQSADGGGCLCESWGWRGAFNQTGGYEPQIFGEVVDEHEKPQEVKNLVKYRIN